MTPFVNNSFTRAAARYAAKPEGRAERSGTSWLRATPPPPLPSSTRRYSQTSPATRAGPALSTSTRSNPRCSGAAPKSWCLWPSN